MNFIKRNLDYVWPALGFAAVLASFWLLFREFRGQTRSASDRGLQAPSRPSHYLLAFGSTLSPMSRWPSTTGSRCCIWASRHISWRFVALCSFTTYALSHNIGASVVSGAHGALSRLHVEGAYSRADRGAGRALLADLSARRSCWSAASSWSSDPHGAGPARRHPAGFPDQCPRRRGSSASPARPASRSMCVGSLLRLPSLTVRGVQDRLSAAGTSCCGS